MRHALVLGAVSLVSLCAPAFGADRSFPFEAAIATREASVYSAPNVDDFYPTQTLRRGDRVTIVREDFGGWYLIQPLEDSHSWISVEDVEKKPNDLGVVKRETSDHIGSNVHSGELYVVNTLFRGEVVRITGRSTLRINGGLKEMYRIEPPRGEFRYIRSRDVLPLDEFERQPDLLPSARADGPASGVPSVSPKPPDFGPGEPQPQPVTFGDSGSQPASDKEFQPGAIQPMVEQGPVSSPLPPFPQPSLVPDSKPEPEPVAVTPQKKPARKPAGRRRTQLPSKPDEGVAPPSIGFESAVALPQIEPQATPQQMQLIDHAWQALQQVDAEFRRMVQRPIPEWDLTKIENQYRAVYGEYEIAAGPDASPLIHSRINQRLAAVQRRRGVYNEYMSFQKIIQRTEARDAKIRQQYLSRFSVATAQPSRTVVRRPLPVRQASRPPQSARAFDGAGIIQRNSIQRPGMPGHVLVAPDGRVLTFLTPAVPGIQLDRFLGRSMGIRGQRQFRRELNADLLAVHQLMPVTLKTR